MDFKGLLDDETLARIDQDAGLQQALALMAASGPSLMPTNLGSILLQGNQARDESRQRGLQGAMQRQQLLDQRRQQEQMRNIAGMFSPGNAQAALAGGGGPTLANAQRMGQPMGPEQAQRALLAAIETGDPKIIEYARSLKDTLMPKQEALFDKIDPSKFEADSLRRFSQTQDYGDLVAKADEPEAIRTLRTLQQNPELFNVKRQLAEAGASRVSVGGGDNAFAKKGAELMASAFNDIAVQGRTASRSLGQISQLETLAGKTGGGIVPAAKAVAGNLGIPVEGLDDVQAFSAVVNQLVPQQRPPGSGTMSDADLALFKQSLPRLINQPGGNAKIIGTMKKIAEYDRTMGKIASDALTGQISREQADMLMQRVPNPLAEFSAGGSAKPKASEAELLQKYGIK